jgi:hypothetical protein
MKGLDEYLTTSDIARARGWSRSYVLQLWKAGRLPAELCKRHHRGKHHRFIATEELLDFCGPEGFSFEYQLSEEELAKLPPAEREQTIADFHRDVRNLESAKTPMEALKRLYKKCEKQLRPEKRATVNLESAYESDNDGGYSYVNFTTRDTAAEIDDKENEKHKAICDDLGKIASSVRKHQKARWIKQPPRQT